jgi:hypothetical protein
VGKIIFTLLTSISIAFGQNEVEIVNNYSLKKFDAIFNEVVYISVRNQKMYYIKNDVVINSYDVSTAKNGIGNQEGSNKTPVGMHSVKEKHGSNIPLNGLFKNRKYYGQIAEIITDTTSSKTDDITTRIMWLTGEETNINKDKNIDSFNRYIYIHGTSEEGKIGTPASHGCIRMRNIDVLNLYNKIRVGTKVLILDK